MVKRSISLLAILAGLAASFPARAAVYLEEVFVTPDQLSTEVTTQMTQVTGNTRKAGDTRIFTLNKSGIIGVTDTATNTTTVFSDLSADVVTSGEHGLLGITFDPDYQTNGWYYVLAHTQPVAGGSVFGQVTRFTDPAIGSGDALSIFRYDTLGTEFHQGGWLDFAQDGTLLLSVGDGSHFAGPDLRNTGQDYTDLLGSILRIDPYADAFADPVQNYAIPAGNLAESLPGAAAEILAYGVRNPFRNSVAPDGNLLIADVGQSTQEEITILSLTGEDRNLGWSLREGDLPTPGKGGPEPADHVAPSFAYDYADGSAIIGGFVYRGSEVPELYGKYIFGDRGTGNIWSIDYDGTDLVDGTLTLIGNVPSLVSFGETVEGELLASQFSYDTGAQLYRFASTVSAVPEPSTWAMMLLGFGVVGAAMRRRNRNVSALSRAATHR